MYCVHLKRKILKFNELCVLSTYSHMFLIYNHYKNIYIYLILHICVFFISYYFTSCNVCGGSTIQLWMVTAITLCALTGPGLAGWTKCVLCVYLLLKSN